MLLSPGRDCKCNFKWPLIQGDDARLTTGPLSIWSIIWKIICRLLGYKVFILIIIITISAGEIRKTLRRETIIENNQFFKIINIIIFFIRDQTKLLRVPLLIGHFALITFSIPLICRPLIATTPCLYNPWSIPSFDPISILKSFNLWSALPLILSFEQYSS